MLKLEIGSKLLILFPVDMIWLFQQITSATINDENAAFRDFMQKLNEGQRKYISWLFWPWTNLLWSKSPQFSGQSGWLGERVGKQGGGRFWKTDLGKQQTASQRNQEEGSECYPSVSEQSSNIEPNTSISQTTDAREEEPEPEQLRTTNPPRHDCAWAIQAFEFMVCRSFWHQRNDFLESSVHGTRPQDADNGKQQPREVILWETVDFAPNWISSKEVHGVAGEGFPALRDGEAVLGGAAAAAHQGG